MGKIRFLLAMSVVAAHGGMLWHFGLLGGKDAVQAFYIISGFYMSLILNEKYVGSNKSYKLFISNRYLRIAPIYWVMLIATLAVNVAAFVVSKGRIQGQFSSYLNAHTSLSSLAYLLLTNIFIAGQDLALFLGLNPHTGNLYFLTDFFKSLPQVCTFMFLPQAWTLGLEITFYLIAPFIVRRGMGLNISLIALSLALRLIAYNYYHLQQDPWTYRFFPFELMFFLMGYLSFRIYQIIKDLSRFNLAGNWALGALIVFTLAYSFIGDAALPYTPFSYKQIAYVLLLTAGIPFMFNAFKNNRWDNKIGELSYPIYISHILLIHLLLSNKTHLPHPELLTIALTILVSILLVRYVSQPFEQYRQGRLAKRNKKQAL